MNLTTSLGIIDKAVKGITANKGLVPGMYVSTKMRTDLAVSYNNAGISEKDYRTLDKIYKKHDERVTRTANKPPVYSGSGLGNSSSSNFAPGSDFTKREQEFTKREQENGGIPDGFEYPKVGDQGFRVAPFRPPPVGESGPQRNKAEMLQSAITQSYSMRFMNREERAEAGPILAQMLAKAVGIKPETVLRLVDEKVQMEDLTAEAVDLNSRLDDLGQLTGIGRVSLTRSKGIEIFHTIERAKQFTDDGEALISVNLGGRQTALRESVFNAPAMQSELRQQEKQKLDTYDKNIDTNEKRLSTAINLAKTLNPEDEADGDKLLVKGQEIYKLIEKFGKKDNGEAGKQKQQLVYDLTNALEDPDITPEEDVAINKQLIKLLNL